MLSERRKTNLRARPSSRTPPGNQATQKTWMNPHLHPAARVHTHTLVLRLFIELQNTPLCKLDMADGQRVGSGWVSWQTGVCLRRKGRLEWRTSREPITSACNQLTYKCCASHALFKCAVYMSWPRHVNLNGEYKTVLSGRYNIVLVDAWVAYRKIYKHTPWLFCN